MYSAGYVPRGAIAAMVAAVVSLCLTSAWATADAVTQDRVAHHLLLKTYSGKGGDNQLRQAFNAALFEFVKSGAYAKLFSAAGLPSAPPAAPPATAYPTIPVGRLAYILKNKITYWGRSQKNTDPFYNPETNSGVEKGLTEAIFQLIANHYKVGKIFVKHVMITTKSFFPDLSAALYATKADFILDTVTITDERSKIVSFSSTYAGTQSGILAAKGSADPFGTGTKTLRGFVSNLKKTNQKVGVARGTVYNTRLVAAGLEVKFIVYVSTSSDLPGLLTDGKAPYVITDNVALIVPAQSISGSTLYAFGATDEFGAFFKKE